MKKFLKQKKAVKAKNGNSGGNYIEKDKLSVQQLDYVKNDMETLRTSFADHIHDGGPEMARKMFRQQWSVTCDIVTS